MNDKRVLIADDVPGVRALLKRMFEVILPGYQVVVVADAFEASDQLNQEPFDLVLTDYEMPGRNGLDLASDVRRASPWTRIVLMSGNGVLESSGALDTQQVDAYLHKPFTMAEVLSTVEQVMRSYA
jgi:CheY-like chemotaxis protein